MSSNMIDQLKRCEKLEQEQEKLKKRLDEILDKANKATYPLITTVESEWFKDLTCVKSEIELWFMPNIKHLDEIFQMIQKSNNFSVRVNDEAQVKKEMEKIGISVDALKERMKELKLQRVSDDNR